MGKEVGRRRKKIWRKEGGRKERRTGKGGSRKEEENRGEGLRGGKDEMLTCFSSSLTILTHKVAGSSIF